MRRGEYSHDARYHHILTTVRSLTTDEWMTAIQFLTRVGQTCTPLRQEFVLLSDTLGVSALVDALNNPPASGGTASSVLGPFFTEDAPEGQQCIPCSGLGKADVIPRLIHAVENGDSIASEGKGEYMYVEGRVLSTDGTPIPNASIETWETDAHGKQDASPCSILMSADFQYRFL